MANIKVENRMYTDEDCMKLAIREAESGLKLYNYPFGCCIKMEDEIITAHNTCVVEKSNVRHAEINAIDKLMDKRGREKIEIFCTTEPCLMCLGAIHWSGIKRVVYGCSIKDSIAVGFNEIDISIKDIVQSQNLDIEIVSGYMRNECEELFLKWKKINRIMRWVNHER